MVNSRQLPQGKFATTAVVFFDFSIGLIVETVERCNSIVKFGYCHSMSLVVCLLCKRIMTK